MTSASSRRLGTTLALPLVLLFAGRTSADVITLKSGRQITGIIESGNAREIGVRAAGQMETIAIDEVQSIAFSGASAAGNSSPAAAAAPSAASIVIPAGSSISVQTIDVIDSRNADLSREYMASLADPILVNNAIAVPRGAQALLRVTQLQQAGKLSGRAVLGLQVVAIVVNGQRVLLQTGDAVAQSKSQTGKTATRGGIGAGLGAGLGALLAGGKGAAIGAITGGAIGTTSAALSGEHIQVPSETKLTFTLSQPAAVQ